MYSTPREQGLSLALQGWGITKKQEPVKGIDSSTSGWRGVKSLRVLNGGWLSSLPASAPYCFLLPPVSLRSQNLSQVSGLRGQFLPKVRTET